MGQKSRRLMAEARMNLSQKYAERHANSPEAALNPEKCAGGCGGEALHTLHVPGKPDRPICNPMRCGVLLAGDDFSKASVSKKATRGDLERAGRRF